MMSVHATLDDADRGADRSLARGWFISLIARGET